MAAVEAVSASAVENRRPALRLRMTKADDRLILILLVLELLRPKADTDTDRENIIKALLRSIIVIVNVVRVSAETAADAPSFIFFVQEQVKQSAFHFVFL